MKEIRQSKSPACYQFDLELEAYLEGENRPFVRAHVQECAFCSVLLADLEMLRSAAREITPEEPSPVVWSNIRAQLVTAGAFAERPGAWNWLRQLSFLHRPLPVAAFGCLFILGCLLAVPRNYPERAAASGVAVSPAGTALRSMAFVGESDELEKVVRELEQTFRAREGSLAPDLKATYETGLDSLNTSIRECNASLQREPDNSLAHEYLLTAYSQKAEVLSSALQFEEGR
jgi:hypothetical protein